jgi:hypothetical protein
VPGFVFLCAPKAGTDRSMPEAIAAARSRLNVLACIALPRLWLAPSPPTLAATRRDAQGEEMRVMTTILLAGLAAPGLVQAMDCSAMRAQQPLQSTVIAPVASELAMASNQLGAPGGVLSQAFDESQSLDQVLLRIRIEGCQNVASVTPTPSVVSPDDPAAYKPRTEFDNTPWRFNMSQNGKNMTADEFSAWMKSRGVRVARGAAPAAPAVAPAAAAPGMAPTPATTPATTTGTPPGTLPASAPAGTPPGTQP